VEPTPVTLPPPFQPPGNWLTRSVVALCQERRLPTRLARLLDRVSIRLGRSTKTVRADGLTLRVRRLTADEHYVREVIVERQYNPAGYEINPADTVVDVGGNIGCFALWAAKNAPRGRVITVEPVEDNFALLVRNIRLNRLTNVTPLRAAVLGESRPATVYLSPEGTGHHSVIAELAHRSPRQETVAGVSLPSLFEQYGLDTCHFLKLDCEGAEFEILSGLPPSFFPRIGKLVVEYHVRPDQAKRRQADGLVEHLQAAGYHIDQYTDVLGTNRGMIYARGSPSLT
jgi:FkbM family methyltransferase